MLLLRHVKLVDAYTAHAALQGTITHLEESATYPPLHA